MKHQPPEIGSVRAKQLVVADKAVCNAIPKIAAEPFCQKRAQIENGILTEDLGRLRQGKDRVQEQDFFDPVLQACDCHPSRRENVTEG